MRQHMIKKGKGEVHDDVLDLKAAQGRIDLMRRYRDQQARTTAAIRHALDFYAEQATASSMTNFWQATLDKPTGDANVPASINATRVAMRAMVPALLTGEFCTAC